MARTKNATRPDGRKKAAIYLGIVDGRKKYKYVYATTQKELDRKVADISAQLHRGIDIASQSDTFGEWAERWLRLKQAEVSEHRHYVYKCRVQNLEPLHNIEISRIRTMDIQEIILDSSGYSRSVLKEILSTARQILQLAVDNRVMDYNPASSVKLPNAAAAKKTERRALTAEEQSWITDTPHRAQTAAMLMMYAGLRRGEVVPLLWTDIDLEACTIRVDKSMERKGNNWQLKQGAKTAAGVRTVYIPDVLADYLRSLERDSFLVVHDTKGDMLSLSAWNKLWDSYITALNFKYGDFSGLMITDPKTGKLVQFEKPDSIFAPKKIPIVIPQITPHWLRHTFITNMYLAGIDVLTAKEQAGHADINTTLQIYTHLDSIHKKKQINKLNDFLKKSAM